MMDGTLIFIFGTIINVLVIGAGAASVFFTMRNSRTATVLVLKDEIIKAMDAKIKSLEDQIQELRNENTRLKSLVDDLMAMEDSRKRTAARPARKTTTSTMHVVKKEE